MYRILRAIAVLFLGSISSSAGNLVITPNTTLQAETANNTSAADSFTATSNGDAAAGNVSKLPISSLLYPGATTQIYAHFQPWYGGSNHMNVGYSSNDATQIHKQISDMISRGMAGMIVDWFGPNATLENTTTKLVMQDLAARGGPFTFAVLEDSGALTACATTSGCSVTSQIISDLTYAYNTYEGSSSYLRLNSRPAVFFFGTDQFTIDWNAVRTQVPGNALFIFLDQNSTDNGFNHVQSDGAFVWIPLGAANPSDIGLSGLDAFYSTALTFPALYTFGAGYIGFNDSLAPWAPSPPIVMNQQCGQTWMQTLAETGKFYSSSNQLESLQIVTWNDYEEGTEIESGIENCVTVSASVAGSTLNWAITGSESTLDHYTVFISTDGQNLMSLQDVPVGTHSLSLATLGLGPGTYYFYVKAVGRPSFHSHMSNAATFNPNDQPPVIVLSVSPTSGPAPLTVTASTAGSTDPDGTITASTINFGDGTVVSATTTSHAYNANGTYTVTATVTDNVGLTATATQFVTVGSTSPVHAVLSVTPTSGIVPLSVTASTSGSSDSQATITSSSIDFGDGTVVNAVTASHTYSKVGLYTVTATLKDSNNNVGTATQAVTVSGVTVITPANGASVTSPVHVVAYAKSTAQITAMRIYVDNVSVYLTFGNAIDTSVVMSNGSHFVVAQAWDGTGAVFKAPLNITVTGQTSDQPPIASLSLSPTSGVAPLTVTASTAGSSDPDGTIVSSKIDFGDGTVVSGPTTSHTYNNSGQFTVTATVTDNAGLSSSTSGTVTVSAPTGSCTLNPTSPSVTICQPAANATLTSPVHIVAGTTDTRTVQFLQIYVDGSKQYQVSGSSLDTSLAMSNGTHRLTVQAYDGAVYFKQTIYITVSSTAPPPGSVTASPISLTFSSQTLNTTSAAQTVTVSNGTSSSATVSSVSTSGDFAQTNNCSSLAAGASCTVRVTFTPTATGTRTGTLALATSGGNVSVSLSGTGASAGTVTVSPTSLTFASQTVNTTSAAKSVTVTNGTSASVSVSSVSTTGDFAQTNNCSSLAAGASCTVRVTFTPAATGTRTGTLSITTSAGGLSVSLTGMGASSSTCTLNPTSPSVTICQPTANSTVSSPVQVIAGTTDTKTVTLIQLYLDGTKVYEIKASSLSTSLSMPAGTHRLTVQAYDGTWFKQTIYITVQ